MTTEPRKTFPTRVDIPADAREALVELLNARLADAFDLYDGRSASLGAWVG